MRKVVFWVWFMVTGLAAATAFAQEVVPPSDAELMSFLAALGGVKSLGALGVVGLVIQGLMILMRTQLMEFAGVWRLIIVTGLSLVGGIVAQMAQGVGLLPALMNAGTLAAAQVFIHQIITQVKKAPAEKK